MIKKLLSSLILVFAVVAGASGADFMRIKSTQHPTDKSAHSTSGKVEKSSEPATKKAKKAKHKNSKEKKGDESDAVSDAVTYMKFKRQFVVPVLGNGKIKSLVILNLNMELNSSAPANIYSLEPKLRDAFMRELLALSHGDAFNDDLTSPETYEKLRATLLHASQDVVKEGVNNVLILDLVRQDQ